MVILKTYKPVIVFIVKFISIYVILIWLYNYYLEYWNEKTDFLTSFVGKTVNYLFHLFHIEAQTPFLENIQGLKLIINGKYIARIVEGCTSINIIIMFTSFILAFGKKIKKSLIFALVGSLLIFIINIFRIFILGYLLYTFPTYQDIAHQIIFPALIYSFVIYLWFIFIIKINE